MSLLNDLRGSLFLPLLFLMVVSAPCCKRVTAITLCPLKQYAHSSQFSQFQFFGKTNMLVLLIIIRNKLIEDFGRDVHSMHKWRNDIASYLYAAQCNGVFPIMSWQLILGGWVLSICKAHKKKTTVELIYKGHLGNSLPTIVEVVSVRRLEQISQLEQKYICGCSSLLSASSLCWL